MATVKIGKLEKQNSIVKMTVSTVIARETPKAILVKQEIRHEGRDPAGHGARWIERNNPATETEEWLPKSQIQVGKDKISVPDWLANKKMLIYVEGKA